MFKKIIYPAAALMLFIGLPFSLACYQTITTKPVQHQYSMVTMNDKGVYEIGGVGTIAFTGSGLGPALEQAGKEGWKVHSVVCPSVGGFVVIVEK